MKRKRTHHIFRYTAIFEPAEEGGYVVSVPKLPGLVTEGDTFEKAMSMAKDAIKGYLQILQGTGEPLPDPDTTSFTAQVDVSFDQRSIVSTP